MASIPSSLPLPMIFSRDVCRRRMSATTGTHFRSYLSHFVSPIPYCVVNSQKVIVIERPGSPRIHTANLYPRLFSTTTKINKEQARGKGKKGGYKDSAICLPPTVFLSPLPPPSTAVLGIKLPPSIPPFLCSPLSLLRSVVPVFHPVTLRVGHAGQRDAEGVA